MTPAMERNLAENSEYLKEYKLATPCHRCGKIDPEGFCTAKEEFWDAKLPRISNKKRHWNPMRFAVELEKYHITCKECFYGVIGDRFEAKRKLDIEHAKNKRLVLQNKNTTKTKGESTLAPSEIVEDLKEASPETPSWVPPTPPSVQSGPISDDDLMSLLEQR